MTGPTRLWTVVIRLAESLCSVCILAITAIVMYEVIARSMLDAPTIWVQECAVYLLIAVAFFGLAPTEHVGENIRIDILSRHFPPPVRHWLEIATCLLIALFAAVAGWGGWQMVQQSLRFGRRSPTLLAVPVWIPQSLLPIGMALLLFGALWAAWRLLRKSEPDADA